MVRFWAMAMGVQLLSLYVSVKQGNQDSTQEGAVLMPLAYI